MNQEERVKYRQQIEQWRKNREEGLRAPDGWLSLTDLFILQDGDYSLGSEDGNDVVLPPSAPARLGTLTFHKGIANLTVTTDVPVLANSVPVQFVELADHHNGQQPTQIKVGSVSFNLHKFGNDFALRIRDSANPAIQAFSGCNWYAVNRDYCVPGKLTRQSTASVIPVVTSVETAAEYQSIGAVEFELLGQPLQLLATATSKPNELFIIFRDSTSQRETYEAGRYLYVEVDAAGNVIMDFNKAYHPPCAFTHYATCSLPPRANILPVAIEAGERY